VLPFGKKEGKPQLNVYNNIEPKRRSNAKGELVNIWRFTSLLITYCNILHLTG
jgi:hypothetical protein